MEKETCESELTKSEMLAIENLCRDLRTNKFVSGEMQFTDITNCDYFVKAYIDRIRYCISWKKFLLWNGTCWEVDKAGYVEDLVINFIHKMYRGLRVINDLRLQVAFERHLIKSESYRRLQSLINLLKITRDIKVVDEDLDNNTYLFNVEGKTLNLKTRRINKPDQKQLITKKSLFVYDKNAKCSTWDKFLMQVFNDDLDLIRFVQKAMGYSLSGDVSEQCMFILWGTGANGKSTFLNVMQNLFGDYASTARTETFMKKTSEQSNDLARLKNARLVTTSEVEQNKPLSESLIKQITGGDQITARFLYGEYFSFWPTFKIFMSTNHKPKITGGDNGIWRRIKMIPFTVTIPPEKRDKNLMEKLMAENSGILNWLLEGFRLWEKEGLLEPAVVREANEEYRFYMNSVGSFVVECLEVDASQKTRLLNSHLYNTYTKWCEKNGEMVMSHRRLSSQMLEKGFRQLASNGNRWWLDLSIRKEWEM